MSAKRKHLCLLACVILCFGLAFMLSPGQVRKAEASSPHIVNSDFSYAMPNLFSCGRCGWHYFELNNLTFSGGVSSCPVHTRYHEWLAMPSLFDPAQFGWRSNQTYDASKKWSNGQPYCLANCVEIQRDKNYNYYAELTATQKGTAIYQDIATEPGAIYKWTLKHASRSNEGRDSMSVMIGTPSAQLAQNATRTSVNGLGNKIGAVGKTIATPSSNSYAYECKDQVPQWETYEGTYVVPAGQTTTRFTFKAISSMRDDAGNLVDDISFTRAFALTYDLCGGSSSEIYSDPNSNDFAGFCIEDSFITPTSFEPTRPGYAFLGWSKVPVPDADSKESYEAARNSITHGFIMPSSAVTLYAVWAKRPTVVFTDENGAILSSQTIDIGSSATAPVPSGRIGYLFSGWDNTYEDVYSDTTVVAQWRPISYRISFEANGAEGTMGDQFFTYGTKQFLAPNDFAHPGYLFVGWNTDNNGYGIPFSNMQEILNLSSSDEAQLTLFAQWQPICYFIEFEENGGSGMMHEQPVLFGEEQPLYANAYKRTGFDWLNWDTDRYVSKNRYSDGEVICNLSETANDIIVLYAIWAAHRCLITYDPNGGSGEMEAQSFSYDSPENLHANSFSRDGFEWASWNTMPDGSGESFSDEQSVENLAEDDNITLTLYAQWTPKESQAPSDPSNGSGSNAEHNGTDTDDKTGLIQPEDPAVDSTNEYSSTSSNTEVSDEEPNFSEGLGDTPPVDSEDEADCDVELAASEKDGATNIETNSTDMNLQEGVKRSFDKTGDTQIPFIIAVVVLLSIGIICLVKASKQRKLELERKREVFRSLLKR